MKLLPCTYALTAALIALACAAPASAQDLALKLKENGEGQEVHKGRALLDLSGETPRLTLRASGLPEEPLAGIPVVGGYLFTANLADIRAVLPRSGGMVAAIQSVTEQRTAEVLSGGLRVRAEPSTEAPIVGNLRGGQQVEVLEERDGWARVRVDYSTEGWSKIAGSRPYLTLRTVPKLTSIEGKRAIYLQRRGPGWEGQVKGGAAWVGDIVLRDDTHAAPSAKRVLVIADRRNSSDGGAFNAYANQIKATYGEQGYQTVIADVDSWEDVVDELEAAASAPFARLILISHGGWDGPIYRGHVGTRQASGKYHTELFERFAAAVRVGTTPEAKIYNSSCHAAGTARDEDVSYGSPYRWVHDLAARTGRQVAGPAGKTSTEWTLRQSLAALEGQGQVVQEVHVARRGQLRILYPGMSLASSRVATLPPVEDLPTPEPLEAAEPSPSAPPAPASLEAPAPAPTTSPVANTPGEALPSATLRTDALGRPVVGLPLGD